MFRRIKAFSGVVALLAVAGFSQESAGGASFQAGAGGLIGWPSFKTLGVSGGLFFDGYVPAKQKGLFYKFGSFAGNSVQFDYINNRDDAYIDDKTRDFYWGGVSVGPAFRSAGATYFAGSVSLLMVGIYGVDTEYGAAKSSYTPDAGATADLSFGGLGTVGVGWRLANGMEMQLDLVVSGAASEKAPGIFGGVGPKFTIGTAF